MGHIISAQGVSVDPEKIKAIVEWPEASTLRDLRGSLGLTGYYGKYVKGYADIAFPLTQQLTKDSLGWNEEAQVVLQKLKVAMTTTLVLRLPNFTQPFEVEADTSGYGLGLTYRSHPIAFFSKVLCLRGQAKSIYEKELVAIVLAVQKWRHYLMGQKFLIWTDPT